MNDDSDCIYFDRTFGSIIEHYKIQTSNINEIWHLNEKNGKWYRLWSDKSQSAGTFHSIEYKEAVRKVKIQKYKQNKS